MKFTLLVQYAMAYVALCLDNVVRGTGTCEQINCSLGSPGHIRRCTATALIRKDVPQERYISGIELTAFCLGITLTVMAISTKYSLAHGEIETLTNQDIE
jgi:hypothetical protein